MIITAKTIEKLNARFGDNWTRNIVEAVGGQWPLRHGWKQRLIGKEISVDIDRLEKIVLKGKRHKQNNTYSPVTATPQTVVAPMPATPVNASTAVSFKRLKVDLTEEQLNAVEMLTQFRKQVQTLGGYAGTGKTTMVASLLERLQGFACCAFTGKAADVLRSKGVHQASTIHSLIYEPIMDGEHIARDLDGNPLFEKRTDISCRGVIVDEASMVGKTIYEDLLSYDIPIIFVGDHGQLEPVGEDIYLMKSPDVRLEQVHRNAGEIAIFASHLRRGGEAKDFSVTGVVTKMSKEDFKAGKCSTDYQVLCAYNRTRVAINQFVRRRLERGPEPEIGDRVVSLRNSRRYGIYNGTQAIIQGLNPNSIRIDINGKITSVGFDRQSFNQERALKDGKLHPFDYAYALTVHKAQGSEWDRVAVIEEVCSLWEHKRWAYTAASRAREHLIWIS